MRMVVFKTYYEHIFYWVVLVKRIFKIIGLLSFFLFGFFYTDKVLEVIREEDSLMIQLKDVLTGIGVAPTLIQLMIMIC